MDFLFILKIPSRKNRSSEIPRDKFDARLGARTSWGRSSDLHSEVELDHLRSLEIKNRAICRAIGLQFVGCWSRATLRFAAYLVSSNNEFSTTPRPLRQRPVLVPTDQCYSRLRHQRCLPRASLTVHFEV